MEQSAKLQEADHHLAQAIAALQEEICDQENRFLSLAHPEIGGDAGSQAEQSIDDIEDIIVRLQFIRAELQPAAKK